MKTILLASKLVLTAYALRTSLQLDSASCVVPTSRADVEKNFSYHEGSHIAVVRCAKSFKVVQTSYKAIALQTPCGQALPDGSGILFVNEIIFPARKTKAYCGLTHFQWNCDWAPLNWVIPCFAKNTRAEGVTTIRSLWRGNWKPHAKLA